ncbi:DUF6263 family protein [Frigoriflavimonas asaccharolytica]|uniref:Uncharacterized protein n=1 Tax=Frigoriflavimonas asaccharolytica TaxID=2735899 RepID=A0A8J8G7E7_9FLAO|nr:DUF6263 family protein [Frigoriflavimonas asaccharolytica]NRS92878.1 hypothetical protein [Frigoriflavimonas asaccharolytica]
MKKITVLFVLSLAIISCKKEAKTITKIDPTTGDTIKIEVANEADSIKMIKEMSAKAAIKDSAGYFVQNFNLEKGKTYPFTTFQKESISAVAPNGEKQNMTRETTDEVNFTVNNFAQDIYDITINFASKKTSQTAQGKTVSVDTKKPAPTEEGLKNKWTLDKAMVGNKLNMKMSKQGKIISITGFEPAYSKFSATINSLTKDANIRKQLLAESKSGFNEKNLTEQFSKNIMILPKKGAKIGDKWSVSENASADGKVKVTTNYTLKKIENGVAEITLTGGIPKQNQKNTMNGVTRSISSDFSQNGSLKFDVNSGWIVNQNIDVKTTQKETINDGKQSQSMTTTTNSSVIVNP